MKKSVLYYTANTLSGLLFSFIGFVNTFWGNDPYFGLTIILVSLIFYLPIISLIIDKIPGKILLVAKIILGFLIIWSSLGVGELFDKLHLMEDNFPYPNYGSYLKIEQ